MTSLNLFFSPVVVPTRGRTSVRTAATKKSGGGSKEKSLLDFILGALQKEEQLYEVDPILQGEEGKTTGTGTSTSTGTGTVGRKNSEVVVPPKKESGGFGGFGGLFAKKG